MIFDHLPFQLMSPNFSGSGELPIYVSLVPPISSRLPSGSAT